MPIFVEWYDEHIVPDPVKMACNQQWAEQCYRMLRDGGIIGTDHGTYIKRDGGLYRLVPAAPTKST
jgi:hypothetical protein